MVGDRQDGAATAAPSYKKLGKITSTKVGSIYPTLTTGNPGNGGAGLEGLAHDGELLVDGTPATLLGLGQNLDGFDVVTGLKHRRKTTSSFRGQFKNSREGLFTSSASC